MKIALVAPRDRSCFATAERLARVCDVEVLATCLGPNGAHDYDDPGVFRHGDVIVRRFRNDHGSVSRLENRLAAQVRAGGAALDLERRWIEERGPHSSALLEHLEDQGDAFDAVVFLGLESALTALGVPRVECAVVVPCAPGGDPARSKLLAACLRSASGIVFGSEEERRTLSRLVPGDRPHAVVTSSLADAIGDVVRCVVGEG